MEGAEGKTPEGIVEERQANGWKGGAVFGIAEF